MCGIAGVLVRDPRDEAASDDALSKMIAALRHRGPDQQRSIRRDGAALVSCRLIVLDPSGGEQPMSDGSGRVHLVYNGEIYNHRELRGELERGGVRFSSTCDSEVVLESYLRKGESCVDDFNGMFAFAVLDERTTPARFFLCRDRLGIKPLYYSVDRDRLIFGSELSAILAACPEKGRELDPVALDQYLCLESIPAPRTLYSSIKKLPPGHRAVGTLDPSTDSSLAETISIEPYWTLSRGPIDGSVLEQCGQEIMLLIEDSVRRRLDSDVPLGVFLSGGIDSGAIAMAAARVGEGEALRTFSLRMPESTYDESEVAARVARSLGAVHTRIDMDEPGPEILDEILPFLSDPIADTSILPTYLLCKGARRSVTVALSGDGGDELFGGYDTYRAALFGRMFSFVPRGLRRLFFDGSRRMLVPTDEKKGWRNSTLRFLEGLAEPASLGHLRWMTYMNDRRREELYRPELWERVRALDPVAQWLSGASASRPRDFVDRMVAIDLHGWLPDDILAKVDRASMACSLEVRVPFLDHRLVQRVSRLPSRMKIGATGTKILLRSALRGRLPDEVLTRKKEGFSSPVKLWLNQRFAPLVDDLVGDDAFFRRVGLRRETVIRWVEEHRGHRENHAHRIWSLLILQRLGIG